MDVEATESETEAAPKDPALQDGEIPAKDPGEPYHGGNEPEDLSRPLYI